MRARSKLRWLRPAASPLERPRLFGDSHRSDVEFDYRSGTSLVFLALLGALAAGARGANVTVGARRVTFWGALAMGVTAGVGPCSEQ